MFVKNDKPTKIIGFQDSSIAQQYFEVFNKEGLENVSIITPEDFFSLSDKNSNQYIVAFYIDMDLRKSVCDLLDELRLDCLTYIDDTVYMFSSSKIGKGCFIGHLCEICWNASVGDHCYFDNQSGIGHDVILGRNSIISSKCYVGGRTKIGENCKFYLNGSVLNNITICDNVTLCALSSITKDVTIPGTYAGRKARLIDGSTTDQNH